MLRVHIWLWIIPAYPTTTFSCVPPLYPPTLLNVNEAILKGKARTNSLCESWNRGFASLVEHAPPTLWALIKAIPKVYLMV